MTDPTPHPDDELVSAYLDGEASAEEIARVDADPALRTRLAAFRQVRAAVGAAVEAPAAADRERAVARALEAGVRRPVADLDDARARARARRRTRWVPVASVAAAVLLLLAAVPLLSRLGDDSSDDLAATAAATTTAGASDASAEEDNEAASPQAHERRALGVVDDEAALRHAVEDALVGEAPAAVLSASTTAPVAGGAAGDSSQPDAAAPAPTTCEESIAVLFPDLGVLLLTGEATLRGEPVEVFVYRLADPGAGPTRQLLALSPSTCAIVNAQTF
jgi:negative regulator of sigma E activity